MTKWKYKVAYITPHTDLEFRLTQLGLEGWELVSLFQDGATFRAVCKKVARPEYLPVAIEGTDCFEIVRSDD